MLCMETYLFCFSIRLGLLISSTLSFISLFIPWLLLLIYGLKIFQPIVDLFNADKDLQENQLVNMFKHMIITESTELKIIFHITLVMHMLANILAIYGVIKLKKIFIIPLALCEGIRVLYGLVSHIFLMQASNGQINLSLLIIATLAGGFLLLFWAYNCCACLAFYQIIVLIGSSKYQQLYGNDPFNPIITSNVNHKYDSRQQSLTLKKSTDGIIRVEHGYSSMFQSKNRNNRIKPGFISVLPTNFRSSNLPTKKVNILPQNYEEPEWKNYKRKWQPSQLHQQPTQYQSQKYANTNVINNY